MRESGGAWRGPVEVPGSVEVSAEAQVNDLSCPSAGNCAAGGLYADRTDHPNRLEAFVDTERDGRWGKAIEVPGV